MQPPRGLRTPLCTACSFAVWTGCAHGNLGWILHMKLVSAASGEAFIDQGTEILLGVLPTCFCVFTKVVWNQQKKGFGVCKHFPWCLLIHILDLRHFMSVLRGINDDIALHLRPQEKRTQFCFHLNICCSESNSSEVDGKLLLLWNWEKEFFLMLANTLPIFTSWVQNISLYMHCQFFLQ